MKKFLAMLVFVPALAFAYAVDVGGNAVTNTTLLGNVDGEQTTVDDILKLFDVSSKSDAIWQAVSNRTDELVKAQSQQSESGDYAPSSNVYTKAETDARIVELAPAPANYATVSNRAMNAIQDHQPLTNYYTKGETEAKIVELAPTPGNYAVVSNAAMNALQEHQSLQNYYNKAETEAKIAELAPPPGDYANVSNKAVSAAPAVKNDEVWQCWDGTELHLVDKSVGDDVYPPPYTNIEYWAGTNYNNTLLVNNGNVVSNIEFRLLIYTGRPTPPHSYVELWVKTLPEHEYAQYPVVIDGTPDTVIPEILSYSSDENPTNIVFGLVDPEIDVDFKLPIVKVRKSCPVVYADDLEPYCTIKDARQMTNAVIEAARQMSNGVMTAVRGGYLPVSMDYNTYATPAGMLVSIFSLNVSSGAAVWGEFSVTNPSDIFFRAEDQTLPAYLDSREASMRQDMTNAAASAAHRVQNFVWDAEEEICYLRQMSHGFLQYIAITNIDLTNPTNSAALKAWEDAQ